MYDPFYGAKLRIGRAEEHLDDLDAKIVKFFDEKPYTRVVDPDSDGVHEIHKFRFTKRFPFRWRILATEIIEHLRASLDHATFATALLTNKINSNFVAFPFADDVTKLGNSIRGRSKDLLPEIQTLLRAFQPYKGGNDLLYALNQLGNTSKHSLVAFTAIAAAHFEIQGTVRGNFGPTQLYEPPRWDRENNEIPYARVQRGFHFEHQMKMGVYVALENIEVMLGHPATAVLDAMASEAKRVVLTIEAECRRIRLIT